MSQTIQLADAQAPTLLIMRLFAFILALIETFQFAIIFAYVRGNRIYCENATAYFGVVSVLATRPYFFLEQLKRFNLPIIVLYRTWPVKFAREEGKASDESS